MYSCSIYPSVSSEEKFYFVAVRACSVLAWVKGYQVSVYAKTYILPVKRK